MSKIRSFFSDNSTKDMRTILYWFLAFFVFIVIVLWGFHGYMNHVLDTYFGSGFYIGLLSAFVENFIFFGVIGLIAQFVSMKPPEDQNFERRIEAVANASFANPTAKGFLIAENKKLLAFNQTADVRLVIKEIDRELGAIKIYTEFNNTIVNMCRDIDYSLINTPAEAEAELFINEVGGEVTHLSLTDESIGKRQTIIEGEAVTLNEGTAKYKYIIRDFKVSANSRANWKFAFWLWGSMNNDRSIDNNWYYAGVNRFTADFKLRVVNKTIYKIGFEIRYPDRKEKTEKNRIEKTNLEILPSGDILLVSGIVFNPYDKFELFFCTFD